MNIVITGASDGIGKALALAFAAKATHLFICARSQQKLQQVANQVYTINKNCVVHTQVVDVCKIQEVKAFGAYCNQVGAVDILINNAGVFMPGNISSEAEEALPLMIETNLYSAYYLTKTVLPLMMQVKRGHIFNICSIASLQAYDNGGSYSISKYALQGFTHNLRHELKPYGIKVTSILPGPVYTNSWAGSGVEPERIMTVNDICIMVQAAAQLSPQACVEEILINPQLGSL